MVRLAFASTSNAIISNDPSAVTRIPTCEAAPPIETQKSTVCALFDELQDRFDLKAGNESSTGSAHEQSHNADSGIMPRLTTGPSAAPHTRLLVDSA